MSRHPNIYVVNPTFYLDSNEDAHGNRKVMLSVVFGNKRVRMVTGVKLHPRHWNPAKHRVRSTHDNAGDLNTVLSTIETTTRRIYTQATTSGASITPQALKERLEDALTGRTDRGLFDYYAKFMQSREATHKYSGQKSHQSTLARLKKFTESKRQRIDFSDLDADFFTAFLNFLITNEGLTNNTIASHLRRLTTFLHWCEDTQNVDVPKAYRMKEKSFKIAPTTVEHIALSIKELQRLENVDLSSNERLRNVRDMFLLGCFTGLRYSDLSRLRPDNIHEGSFRVRTEKTKDLLSIPITPPAQRILNRLSLLDFRHISNQKFNAYIKEVCLRAGMESLTTITRYSGAKKIEITRPKYECVSSHTMRRTFVTVSKMLGLDDHTVMAVTGHKSISDFRGYLKTENPVVAAQMNKAWSDL